MSFSADPHSAVPEGGSSSDSRRRGKPAPKRSAATGFPVGPDERVAAGARIQQIQQVDALRQQLARLEGAPTFSGYIPTGWRALDALLPWGGFPRGALVEWFGTEGSGAGLLALLAARAATAATAATGSLPLVVIDPCRQFYPPAAAAWGLEGEQLFLVRPTNMRDILWALDQVLRCRGVAAVWAVLEQLEPRSFRRLQLAVEEGGGLGCLVRPPQARGCPSWAEVQLVVKPLPAGSPMATSGPSPAGSPPLPRRLPPLSGRRWSIELARYRGVTRNGTGPRVIELELDEQGQELSDPTQEIPRHATYPLPLVSPLASPADARRQARA